MYKYYMYNFIIFLKFINMIYVLQQCLHNEINLLIIIFNGVCGLVFIFMLKL